jgi:large subunit ribosomal protein L15
MSILSTLRPASGARKSRHRVGRGPGSGRGKTSTRGQKGLKSRSGARLIPGFEGGQMPLQRRLPKRGFKNIFKVYYQVVNVADVGDFEPGTMVTPELLQARGKIKSTRRPVKILGTGNLTTSLTIQADKFSQAARQKIVAAGGTAEEKSA